MNAIDERFASLRAAGKKAFIPFVTAGDPDIATTAAAIRELDSAGSHLIEIGFPFSDPIADGPVIQASYTRALERGLKLQDIFECVQGLRSKPDPVKAPLIGMVSYTMVFRRGVDAFVKQAADVGISGLIVPDLPVEESDDFCRRCTDADIRTIMLVAPTTPRARTERIVKQSSGFIYCLSFSGITGERDELPDELIERLQMLRRMTDRPICVGFGVSRPEHVRMLRKEADGVIVGSAIVRRLQKAAEGWQAARGELRTFVQSLVEALNPG